MTPEPDSALPTERAPRLDAITGLRWWAAFAVFGFHMMFFAPLPPSIAHVLVFGDYGVAFFFVLSGFVLTWSMRPGLPRRHRVSRGFPSASGVPRETLSSSRRWTRFRTSST